MFVFEDKTGLRKICSRYRRELRRYYMGVFVDTNDKFRRSSDVEIAVQEIGFKKTWEFLEYAPLGYVLAPSGQLIQLDQQIWTTPFDVYQPFNGLINLRS